MNYQVKISPNKFRSNELLLNRHDKEVVKIAYFGSSILGAISLAVHKLAGKIFPGFKPIEISLQIGGKTGNFSITQKDCIKAIHAIAQREQTSLTAAKVAQIIKAIKADKGTDTLAIIASALPPAKKHYTDEVAWSGTYRTKYPTEPDESAPPQERIKLCFVGDIMGHENQINAAKQKDSTYDYAPAFRFVKPIIRAADLAIGNLEVTFAGPPHTGYPKFSSPDALAATLKDIGIALVSTGNNHCNDCGPEGLVRTLDVLDQHAIAHTGTFRNPSEREQEYPLIVEKNGFKLAFLNYTYGTNGHFARYPTMINRIDDNTIEQDMEKARKLEPDAIIVLMHWGEEYDTEENDEQKRLAGSLLEMGALLVIGTHPHVLQPIREHQHHAEKKVVAYSLGNFISGQSAPQTDCSLIYEVELVKHGPEDTAHIAKQHYIPVFRHIQKGTYMTVPISPFKKRKDNPLQLDAEERKSLKERGKWIRKVIGKSHTAEERKLLVSTHP